MTRNLKICPFCKWVSLVEAKCAVCNFHDKFEPMLTEDDLTMVSSLLVKDTDSNISIFKVAVLKWGKELQINMITEESIELAIASLDYNFQSQRFGGYTYYDLIGSMLAFIKQALKDARKNKFPLNAKPFDMDDFMKIMEAMFKGEIRKQITNKKDVRDGLIEELADVEIMIGQARHGMGLGHEIDKIKQSKLARLRRVT